VHEVIERQQTAIAELCRRHHVRRLDLFGSGARGVDFDPRRSDLDFVVEFGATGSGPTLRTFFAPRNELAALFGRPVDLVVLGSVTNPYIRAEVERTREPVYAA
jgi:predicted nucleotidyltransferase